MLPPPPEVVTFRGELTDRELHILRHSTPDRLVKEIADALGLHVETVISHRKNALKKWLAIIDQRKGGRMAFRHMMRRVRPFLFGPESGPAVSP